jgi:excisionase family DNA binding protein
MTATEASRVLGVSTRQVERLVASGALSNASRVGRTLLIDANAVNHLRITGTQRGRPWKQQTDWVAIELLSYGASVGLNSSQRSRLRRRLRTITPAELVRLARHRATVRRYRVSVSFLPDLRGRLALTAIPALSVSPELAARFGLAVASSTVLDGYVDTDRAAMLTSEFLMFGDTEGNVTLRSTATGHLDAGGQAPVAAVALDLAESLDPRERSAGSRVLTELLAAL